MTRLVKWLRRLALAGGSVLVFASMVWGTFELLDRAFPPTLPASLAVSAEVADRDGTLLRAYATPDGRWRLAATLDQVDPQFVRMLLACEAKRFYDHPGVDVLALGRAAAQFAASGHIVSGGSTLTMQLARLIEPREGRSLASKVRQIFRALQLERRLTKRQILESYLNLAPYGGNLEGVRAAALGWFGKEPKRLALSETALLVSLPQLPEVRRPDRNPAGARAARDGVLARLAAAGLLGETEAARAALDDLAASRRALPALAAHAADAALRNQPTQSRLQQTIRRSVQEGLEAVALETARKVGPRVSVAMVLADAVTGEILGEVGSANYFDARRSGWIDMSRTLRSPGSTLKPFIYGLAIEEGLVAQETLIEDRPADFAGYRPKNFDMTYKGDVTVRQALQLSLNVPAIRLLDAVGPQRLVSRFRQSGVTPALPPGEVPGLAIGLGGVGVTLRDLVQLYTGLANGGDAKALRDGSEAAAPEPLANGMVLEPQAAWQVTDMLAGVRPPVGAAPRAVAYKTGTSYGNRDAWSIGYDGRYVLGVWVGRPDSGSVPGISGYETAAPALFEAFARSGLASAPFRRPPAGAFRPAAGDLPVTLERFVSNEGGLPYTVRSVAEPAPRIVFPPDGARVELGASSHNATPLVLKLQGGRAPFRWLANGKPLGDIVRRREATWRPDGAGYSTLTVIDDAGRAASVKIFVE